MILLDTHVLIWYLAGHPLLPKAVRQKIENTPQVFVSAASIWELGIKGSLKGKAVYLRGEPLDSPESLMELAKASADQGIKILSITAECCALAPFFSTEHKDPFDRMIAAHSIVPEKLTLISADGAFDSFGPEISRYWPDSSGAKTVPPKKKPSKSVL